MTRSDQGQASGRGGFRRRLAYLALSALLRLVVRPMLSARVPIAMQRMLLKFSGLITRLPSGVRTAGLTLNGIDAERVSCGDARDAGAAVLYLHGGGYCIGSPASDRAITARFAQATGLPVFVPDYRLAPEHPFPAALDDALAAYRALQVQGFTRIVVAGDSAGGGLSLALTLKAAQAHIAAPTALVLFSPWVDLDPYNAASMRDAHARDPMLTAAGLRKWAEAYLGALRERPKTPYCSPLNADMTGLPPTLIQGGGQELMLPEFKALAELMQVAGVMVELQVEPDLWHVYQIHAGVLAESDAAFERVAAFIKPLLTGGKG